MYHECHYVSSHPYIYSTDQIEQLITKTKEEAISRKEILEKVEKWLVACQEESWLEEYNRVCSVVIHNNGYFLILFLFALSL